MRKKDARDVAVSAITAFRKRNAWSDGFLRNEIRANELTPRDAAFASEIVNGVLENSLLLNFYISKFSSIKLNKISPGILDILQMAVYQILFLDRIPDSAAVNDAVSRAKRNNPKAAGFVNAVARKVSASKENLPKPQGTFSEKLSVQYSHPIELVNLFISEFGEEETERILAENNKKSKVFARVNTLKTTREDLTAEDEEVLSFKAGRLDNSVEVSFSGNIEKSNAFANGHFHIQDEASQIAASLLAPKRGSRVLDACAAPGGKSFLLAELMENEGELVSCDIHEHKLELIKKGAKRLGIDIISTALRDASEFAHEFEKSFDYILADVPCSGFGIIRKKPDIRYKSVDEAGELPTLQLRILKNLSRYLKPEGTLVYSTCTILSRENSDVIEAFLKENGDFCEEKVKVMVPCKEEKYGITLLPHISGTDGFYMCKLRRKK
ncbi:MAG: 16S rRNA (cytosine(967)-C(5))-methyltransferase RsmB [Oscillospiraceae bacterium]|nr:16S rRNA (cytosine(967)-C(5))-methyltransferase RsmB [Oscillospiraceae bacterium]